MEFKVTQLPILIIGFNRPDLLEGLIKLVSEVKPKLLFVAIDGPRKSNNQDNIQVEKCRNAVNKVNWNCKLYTLFSDKNHGADLWPKISVNWAFKKCEELLILEDDIRISPSFYELAKFTLHRYSANDLLFAICAWNLVKTEEKENNDSYLYTKYFMGGGGWAISKRKWEIFINNYEKNSRISMKKILKYNNFNIILSLYYKYIFLGEKDKTLSWDHEIVKFIIQTGRLNILSAKNLAKNIGIGDEATHTKSLPTHFIEEIDMDNIRSPRQIAINTEFEYLFTKTRMKLLLNALNNRLTSSLGIK